jgi:hypothetical protein
MGKASSFDPFFVRISRLDRGRRRSLSTTPRDLEEGVTGSDAAST